MLEISDESSVGILHGLRQAAPMVIQKVRTDHSSQFTDRFTCKEKRPSGEHDFDKACRSLGIEQRLSPPKHPQSIHKAMEWLGGSMAKSVKQTRFTSAAELETTRMNDLKIYNHQIPQRAINHQTPIQALKNWQKEKPDLFVRDVHNLPRFDTRTRP